MHPMLAYFAIRQFQIVVRAQVQRFAHPASIIFIFNLF